MSTDPTPMPPTVPAETPSRTPSIAAFRAASAGADGAEDWLGCEALHPLTWLPAADKPAAGWLRRRGAPD